MRRKIAILPAAALIAAGAQAQSLNIDFGDLVGVPDDGYGAAGLSGVWNGLAVGPGEPQPLVGLIGQRVEATVAYTTGGLSIVDDRATEDDDERLLEDGIGPFGNVKHQAVLEGLENDHYVVIVYAWKPGLPAGHTFVMVGGTVQDAAGQWPGGFQVGVTHVVFDVEVTDGTLTIAAAGSFGSEGFLNGVQIRRISAADVNGDGLVDDEDLLELLGDWGDCAGCPTDLNEDGVVSTADLLELLADWG